MEEHKDWHLFMRGLTNPDTGAGILLSQHRFDFKAIEQECELTGEPIEEFFKRLASKSYDCYLAWKTPNRYDGVEFFSGDSNA